LRQEHWPRFLKPFRIAESGGLAEMVSNFDDMHAACRGQVPLRKGHAVDANVCFAEVELLKQSLCPYPTQKQELYGYHF